MTRTDRQAAQARYFVRFAATALLLVSGTLLLVLVVLPQRYVLDAGFRESGLNFPEPTVPFATLEPIRVAALPVWTAEAPPFTAEGPPFTEAAAPRGPAEILWADVSPLLAAERFDDAVPLFQEYLEAHPEDDRVRRELATTLWSAGRVERAIPVARELLARSDDRPIRLALARALRDEGRLDEATAEYAELLRGDPADESLALEWARALSWGERYEDAEAVLDEALRSQPRSAPLRIELARALYYDGDLFAASALLESMSDGEVVRGEGRELRATVRSELTPPEATFDTPPAPSLLERAVRARGERAIDLAGELFACALEESPDDAAIWLAYADFLQYELNDMTGARDALLEVERLGGSDPSVQFRLALLESWTGMEPLALARLESLLAGLPEEPQPTTDAGADVTRADVHALIGDLERWSGHRVAAAKSYRRALQVGDSERAREGLDGLRAETRRLVQEVEGPGVGSLARGMGDSDDFSRVDLGGAWAEVRDEWAWSASVGRRWMSGWDPTGGSGNVSGTFLEASPSRWWRWGTIRTQLHLGAEWIREDDPNVSFGALVQLRPANETVIGIAYDHGPSYGLAGTLESVVSGLDHDRLTASWSRSVGERWRVSGQADAARLHAAGVPDAEPSDRLQASVAAVKAVSPAWTLGWSLGAIHNIDASPAPAGGRRLYWDPNVALSTGPVARLAGMLADGWEASLGASPGLAVIDERGSDGFEAVPQISLDARLSYEGPQWRGTVALSYGSSRLEGYRSYGIGIAVGTSSWSSRGPVR